MSNKTVTVSIMTFLGHRFDDHGLDVSVLPELLVYQKLLVGIMKERWRVGHPDRERLPKGFEDNLALKVDRLEAGSVVVPLQVDLHFEESGKPTGFCHENELLESARIIEDALKAAYKNETPPDELPVETIFILKELGKTLLEEESLTLQSSLSSKPALVDSCVQERITSWLESTYHDSVDLKGKVISVDLEGETFTLKLANGLKVSGKFSSAQQEVITKALHEHESLSVFVSGRGEFLHQTGLLKRVVQIDELKIYQEADELKPVEEQPVWEMIDELISEVPMEAFEKLPDDGAENHGDYLRERYHA